MAQVQSLTSELLLAQLPSATWTINPELQVTSWSGGGLMSPGSFHGVFTGRPLSEVYRANGIDLSSLELHWRALEGVSSSFLVTVSGRDFQVNVSPLRGAGDHIAGAVGVAFGVTEGARKVERLRQEAAFGRAVSTFFGHVVRYQFEEGFYERLVEAAIDMVRGAQAGSFWLRDEGGLFKPMATVGFGSEVVEDVVVTGEELVRAGPSHESHRVADLNAPERRRSPAPLGEVRETLTVPVILRGDVIAFLRLHSFEAGDALDEDAHEFMKLFANELAALFNHTDLQRTLRNEQGRLEHLLEEYKALAEFGAEIETIHDPGELIEHGMKRLLKVFKFDAAMFSEVRGDALHYTRVRGNGTKKLAGILKEPQPLGAGINGRVAMTGQPLYVEDYTSWPHSYEPYVKTGVLSMLALPIRRSGRVLHTLAFATIDRRASLDDNAVRIAKGFVNRLENAFERAHHLAEIKATQEATFRSLGVALEYRDLETHGHTDRVVKLSRHFANILGLGRKQRQALAWGAYLHDVGKIAVPDEVLLKPGRLTDEEFAVVRRHTIFGVDMIKDIPFLPAETREVVRSHHERWDGGGYPDQLAGNDIPLLARMFSLVDVYDALRSERPYKRAWTHEDAVGELEKQAGGQFDPDLTRRFLETIPE